MALVPSYSGHHQADLIFIGFPGVHDAADLAAAEHHDLVAEFYHHVQILADENDGYALLFLFIEQIVNGIRGVITSPLTA